MVSLLHGAQLLQLKQPAGCIYVVGFSGAQAAWLQQSAGERAGRGLGWLAGWPQYWRKRRLHRAQCPAERPVPWAACLAGEAGCRRQPQAAGACDAAAWRSSSCSMACTRCCRARAPLAPAAALQKQLCRWRSGGHLPASGQLLMLPAELSHTPAARLACVLLQDHGVGACCPAGQCRRIASAGAAEARAQQLAPGSQHPASSWPWLALACRLAAPVVGPPAATALSAQLGKEDLGPI